MSIKPILTSLVIATLISSLAGCGSDTKVTNTTTHERSVGQQLTDLDQARQQGVVSEEEYERLKKKIIKDNG
jgi:predicted small lipoprotein YifL